MLSVVDWEVGGWWGPLPKPQNHWKRYDFWYFLEGGGRWWGPLPKIRKHLNQNNLHSFRGGARWWGPLFRTTETLRTLWFPWFFKKWALLGGLAHPLKSLGTFSESDSHSFSGGGKWWVPWFHFTNHSKHGHNHSFLKWQGYADTLIQPYSASERFYIVIYNTRKYFASKTCPNISMSLGRLLTVAEWCNFIQIPVDVLFPHADCRDVRSDYRHAVPYQGFGKCFSQTCNCCRHGERSWLVERCQGNRRNMRCCQLGVFLLVLHDQTWVRCVSWATVPAVLTNEYAFWLTIVGLAKFRRQIPCFENSDRDPQMQTSTFKDGIGRNLGPHWKRGPYKKTNARSLCLQAIFSEACVFLRWLWIYMDTLLDHDHYRGHYWDTLWDWRTLFGYYLDTTRTLFGHYLHDFDVMLTQFWILEMLMDTIWTLSEIEGQHFGTKDTERHYVFWHCRTLFLAL